MASVRVIRALYLFAGKRKKDEQKYRAGLMPDTYLVGLNRLDQHGIKAEYIENRWSEILRRFSFNLANLPALKATRRFDIVFSGTNPVLVWIDKVLLRNKKTKWVIYNTFLTNMFKRHSSGLRGRILRRAVKEAVVINPSTPQRDYLLKLGFDPGKMFYLAYGVDREFVDRNLGQPRLVERPYIFSAGKDMGRDYQTLIDAVRGLPIDLHIGASGRNFKDIKNIPENVHISFYKPTDLVAMYEHSELVVIPTFHENHLDASDCSGQYVLLESMMCGKAVIASDRSTIYDYVTPEENAVLVEPENPAALRLAIEALLKDKAKAARLGRAARERAEEHFTTERFARDLANVFKTLLS